MVVVWLGVALLVLGLLYMAAQPMWRGRLSDRRSPPVAGETLEPRRPGAGMGVRSHWQGLALAAAGALLLLLSAAL